MKNVLTSFGDQLLVPGIDLGNAGYLDDESLILTALIHKAKGDQGWYEAESKYFPTCVTVCYCIALINSISEHKRLLWLFCCYSDYEMTEYLLGEPAIRDQVMEDGTNAFTTALARRDSKMISKLLKKLWNEDYHHLTIKAILDIQRFESKCAKARAVEGELTRALVEHGAGVPVFQESAETDNM